MKTSPLGSASPRNHATAAVVVTENEQCYFLFNAERAPAVSKCVWACVDYTVHVSLHASRKGFCLEVWACRSQVTPYLDATRKRGSGVDPIPPVLRTVTASLLCIRLLSALRVLPETVTLVTPHRRVSTPLTTSLHRVCRPTFLTISTNNFLFHSFT